MRSGTQDLLKDGNKRKLRPSDNHIQAHYEMNTVANFRVVDTQTQKQP